eukprot:COSAG03_NODE_1278_length_4415_cov_2.649444_9_plen_31_part_01
MKDGWHARCTFKQRILDTTCLTVRAVNILAC